ncbi:MAG: hypothetical protein OXG58_01420 [Gemmatimonadetes bacterium]|nr:hypothetical protein [Gemmatimonadota bacterium]MCY3943462.1 hypothetical protein [Gemmatimonadota bacterium]
MKRPALLAAHGLLAGIALLAACGEPEPENRAPEVSGAIPALALEVTDTVTVELSRYFSDADGDELRYRGVALDTAALTVAVDGSVLEVVGKKRARTEIHVNAIDPDGLLTKQTFGATVNGKPGTLWVMLGYEATEIGAVLLRLSGLGVDSLEAHTGFTLYSAPGEETVRALVAGDIADGDTLLGFRAGDVTAPGEYAGVLDQAAGTDYRQLSTDSGSLEIVR